jgi:hypothetical protein
LVGHFVSAGLLIGGPWTLVFGEIRPTQVSSSIVIVGIFLLYILVLQLLRKQKTRILACKKVPPRPQKTLS